MTAEWRLIPSYPYYEASSLGQVRRIVPYLSTFVGKVLAPVTDKRKGYQRVGLSHDGSRKTCFVHRLVAEAFHGPQPSPKHEVAHRNGKRADNRASNLRWSTKPENEKDKDRHGTKLCGERHGHARLTDHQVRLIRARVAFGEPILQMACLFGTSFSNAWSIARGHTRRTAGGFGISDE